MKALPVETPSAPGRHPQRHGKKETNPRLVPLKIAIRKITSRLDAFADHDLPDDGILDLLQDTRAQVLNLHIARKELRRHKGKK